MGLSKDPREEWIIKMFKSCGVCVCLCIDGDRSLSNIKYLLQSLSSLFSEKGSLTELEFSNLAILAD